MAGIKTTQIMVFASTACLTTAFAMDPAPAGADSNQNSVKTEDALFIRTIGDDGRAIRFDALENNATGFYSPVTSWSWRLTDRLKAPRRFHTATLLENDMVLVAGGED
jgi:hypothetical protein